MSYILHTLNRVHDYLKIQEDDLEQQLIHLDWQNQQEIRDIKEMGY